MSVCPKCGGQLKIGDDFCPSCGAKIDKTIHKWGADLFRGRIGRKHYFLASLLIIVATLIAYGLVILLTFGGGYVGRLLGLPSDTISIASVLLMSILIVGILISSFYFTILVDVKRFHDFGASGYWSLLYLVPFVNVLMSLLLLLRRGDAVKNRYGESTQSLPLFKAVFNKQTQ